MDLLAVHPMNLLFRLLSRLDKEPSNLPLFLMLKGDESKLLDDPAAQDASQADAGLTDGEKKARVHARAHSELSKKLSKKPKVKGTSAAPIDLEDEENAGPVVVD